MFLSFDEFLSDKDPLMAIQANFLCVQKVMLECERNVGQFAFFLGKGTLFWSFDPGKLYRTTNFSHRENRKMSSGQHAK